MRNCKNCKHYKSGKCLLIEEDVEAIENCKWHLLTEK